jgi:chitodextrinase
MYIFPDVAACTFAGVAYVNGQKSALDGNYSVQVMTHELGHNWGLGHANALHCTSSSTKVAIAAPSACTSGAYQDPFSTMGNNALRHDHAAELGELGFLTSSEKVTGAPGNTYTIAPWFGSGAIKLVRVPRGDGTFFDLDYRMTYGSFDTFTAGSPPVTGVTIRLNVGTASPTTSPKDSNLIDTTPSTTDLKDAPLLPGKTVRDPVSGLSFTTLSSDTSGVKVQVKEGVKPGTPGSFTATADATPKVSLDWTAASDNVAVVKYRVTRNGTSVATVNAPTTSWTDTGVTFGASYTYTVAAIDSSGNVGAAASKSVTVPANPNPTPTPDPSPTAPTDGDVTPPTAPDPLTGTTGLTTAKLAWGASSDDTRVTSYVIWRNSTYIGTVTADVLAWRDGGRKPSRWYTYTVRARDAAGNMSAAKSISLRMKDDTIRPSTPRYFRRVARYGAYVTFAWYRSTDNVKVLKYRIYRVGRTSPIAATTGTKIRIYTIRGARYYVRAVDTSGNRSYRSNYAYGRW